MTTKKSTGTQASPISALARRLREDRRRDAIRRARAALMRLREAGFACGVTGSLARGTFHSGSDIDLVVWCPPEHRSEVLRIAADALGDFPADVLFIDLLDDDVREGVLRDFKTEPPESDIGRTTD